MSKAVWPVTQQPSPPTGGCVSRMRRTRSRASSLLPAALVCDRRGARCAGPMVWASGALDRRAGRSARMTASIWYWPTREGRIQIDEALDALHARQRGEPAAHAVQLGDPRRGQRRALAVVEDHEDARWSPAREILAVRAPRPARDSALGRQHRRRRSRPAGFAAKGDPSRSSTAATGISTAPGMVHDHGGERIQKPRAGHPPPRRAIGSGQASRRGPSTASSAGRKVSP